MSILGDRCTTPEQSFNALGRYQILFLFFIRLSFLSFIQLAYIMFISYLLMLLSMHQGC